jgi:hypothetical protein
MSSGMASAQKVQFSMELSIGANENDEKTSFLTAEGVDSDSQEKGSTEERHG